MNGYTKHFFGYISIAVVVTLVGCSRQGEDTIEFLSPPTLTVVRDLPAKPIVSIAYKANQKATAELLAGGTALSSQVAPRLAKKSNQLTLIGLGFPVDDLRLRLMAESGVSVLSDSLQVPLDVKTLVPFNMVTADKAVKLGAGGNYVFVSAYRETDQGIESIVLAFDQSGRLSWTLPVEFIVTGITQISEDTLGLMSGQGMLRVNFYGQPLNYVAGNRQVLPDTNISIRVPTAYIAAPIEGYENQTLLLIEPEWREIDGGVNGSKKLLGTNILSVSANGSIEKRWSLFDLLDTQRVGQSPEVDTSAYFAGAGAEVWAEISTLKYSRERKEIIAEVPAQGVAMGANTVDNSLNWLIGDSSSWGSDFQSLFLKMSETGNDFINPQVYGVYRNGDILLGRSSFSLLGRYRINDEKKLLEPVVVYSIATMNALAKNLDGFELVTLDGDRLLLINKEAATIEVISADSSENPWLAIEPYADEQEPWRISNVASGITMRVPAQPAPQVVFNERVSDGVVSASEDSPLAGADPRGEPADMSGQWQVIIDGESIPQAHELTLSQNSYSASGAFAGQPIQALIKGNVISFSLRNRSNGVRVVQRFRAVLNENHTRLKGQVDILIDGQLIAQPTWRANRITNNLP